MKNTSLYLGFGSLGALTGFISGLTSAEVTLPLLGMIFGLAGGSVIAFIQKVSTKDRILAGGMILSFSLMCMPFLVAGIVVKQQRFLVGKGPVEATEQSVLKSGEWTQIEKVDNMLRQGSLTCEEAYDELRQVIATDEN